MPDATTAFVTANGLRLWTESFGDPLDPTILLIMGIGTSGIAWDDQLCELLAAGGRHVIRFDNRCSGLSESVDYHQNPFTLTDMARDVEGVLDACGVKAAHIVGASMGGMIAQELAIESPERVLSLTSIVSTPSVITQQATFSTPGLPPMSDALLATFAELAMTEVTDIDERITASIRLARSFIGTATDISDDEIAAAKRRELARIAGHFGANSPELERAIVNGESSVEQSLAIAASRDRSRLLPAVRVPTLVIAGSEDPFFGVAHGQATADAIPGARLVAMEGLGHTPPSAPVLATMLIEHTSSAVPA
jgi:pimeloyl-ACP methyl ester carboxylesterase